jgi:hypothetical protein
MLYAEWHSWGGKNPMRSARIIALALLAICVLVSGTAQAANPAKGTLSKSKKSVKWSGSFTLSEPVNECLGPDDPICDHFMLKVDLKDGSRVRIVLPSPDATTDIDFYVYAPNGALVANSGNLIGEPESAEFRHSARFNKKEYEVRVSPYLVVPGTTYEAMASVR